MIGEVCHFVDTCSAIVGLNPDSVTAVGSGLTDVMLEDNVVLGLHYPDGSIATISYATGGHGSTAKEHVSVLGRGHTAIIDNYSRVEVDGKQAKVPASKGHQAQFNYMLSHLGDRAGTESAIATMRKTIEAVQILQGARL